MGKFKNISTNNIIYYVSKKENSSIERSMVNKISPIKISRSILFSSRGKTMKSNESSEDENSACKSISYL